MNAQKFVGIAVLLHTVIGQDSLAVLKPVSNITIIRSPFERLNFDPRIGGNRGNPGLKLRISSKGLDYANSIAGNLLNTEIRNVDIPDFEKSISKGKVEAKNIRITDFTPPTYRITLSTPSRLGWSTNGGNIAIKGNWKGYKKVTFFKIKGDGSFTASVNDIKISLSANFRRNFQGQPIVNGVSCSARVGSLSVRIKGGIVGWILNLFRGKIADKLKPFLEKAVCDEGKKFVERDVNAKLATFPTTKSLGRYFKLDYRLTSDPSTVGGSIMSEHRGEISYMGQGGATFYPHPLITSGSNSRMLYLYGSDYMVNSLLQSAHKNNKMTYTITEQNMPKVAKYLRTTCSDLCLGTLFPELEEDYPNSKGSMHFATAEEPTVVFREDKAFVNLKGVAQLNVEETGKPKVQVLSMNLTLNAALEPHLTTDLSKAYGTVKINKLTVSNLESVIKELEDIEIQELVDLATPILEELANENLKTGITIPVTKGISLKNARINLMQRTAELSADLTYTG